MKNSIHILFSADDTYARMFLMAVKSLLNTTNATSKMHLHVIDRGIPEHWREMAECYTEDARVHLTWINGIGDALRELPGVPITFHDLPGTGHYDRLLAPFIISGPKALYLDTDLLFQGDVSTLWDESTNGCPIAAVQDQSILTIGSEQGGIDWEDRLLNPEDGYFNSGVLLMDLGMWRDRDLCNKCVECAKEFIGQFGKPPALHDQYALNVVCQGDWQALPRRWNTFAEKVCEKPEDATIVHFAGSHKPFYFSSTRASGGSKYFIRAAKELMQDDFEQRGVFAKSTPTRVDVSVPASFARRFAVAVSAHPSYAHYLPRLLDEWDTQIMGLPVSKFLLYDHPKAPKVNAGWTVLTPEKKPYGEPSPLRNRVLDYDVDWIQYFDADNFPSHNHFRTVFKHAMGAGDDVGLIFPNHIGGDGRITQIPKGRDPRRGFFIDTASCWRREAVLSAGGWQSVLLEDWALSRDIISTGWRLEKSAVDFTWIGTPGNRTSGVDLGVDKWRVADFSIIILLRGDDHFLECVKTDMDRLELPGHCSITVVTDGDSKFHRRVARWLAAVKTGSRFERVTLMRARKQNSPIRGRDDFFKIHSRVANHYSRAIQATPEELILFWEDDIRPEPGAFKALAFHIAANGSIACCGAPYPDRSDTGLAAAAHGRDHWHSHIRMADVTEKPMAVGMIAGGFTLHQRFALEECPVLGPLNVVGKPFYHGWDGFLCQRLNDAGYSIHLVGKSKVQHCPK